MKILKLTFKRTIKNLIPYLIGGTIGILLAKGYIIWIGFCYNIFGSGTLNTVFSYTPIVIFLVLCIFIKAYFEVRLEEQENDTD